MSVEKLSLQTITSPTLGAGGDFAITFGEFEKVTNAVLSFDNPFINSYLVAASTSISGNVVTITVMKQNMGGVGAWVVAITANVAGCKFNALAKGE